MFKYILNVLLIGLLLLGLLSSSSVAADKRFFNIASGPSTGTWYPITARIAELIKPVLPDCVFRVSTGGGIYNIKAVDEGKDSQLGVANSDSIGAAWKGGFPFEKAYKNIRGISNLYGSPMHIVTLEKTGITDPKEFGNKRLAVGAPGHSEEVSSRQLLKEYGWTYESIAKAGGKISFIDMSDSATALADGHIDAYINVIGPPVAHTTELALLHKIRILDISDDVRDSFVKNNPGFFKTEIPANMYRGQTKAVKTVGVSVVLFCKADVPEEVVYKITKTMYEKAAEIRKTKKQLRVSS